MSRVLSTVEKCADGIGFEIGNSDDHKQAELLNGFARGFCNSMSGFEQSTQLCSLVDLLTPKAMYFIEELHGFVEYRKKEHK
jgi:hypothetical protein